ncbi:MAG: DUF6714 family protein [Phycisphaerae bacterium]
MDRDRAAQLVKDIRVAFADVERGAGTTLSEARAMDDYRSPEDQKKARQLDTDVRWWEIPKTKIEKLYDAFTFLDAEGMRYYIAPFLIYDLENPDSDLPVGDSVVGQLERTDIADSFAIFDSKQSAVIARYLQARAEDSETDPVIAKEATKALRRYWGSFLPETS